MKQMLLNLILYAIAWLLHKSCRYRYFDYHHRQLAQENHPKGATALALWHGNSFIGTLTHTYQPYAPLCSMSPDGQMVAFLCKRMGLDPVNGSSSKGGKEARNTLESVVADGISPAFTVDGPKGPKGKSKNGVIDVARKTGISVLPMIALADRYWQLGSWDRLRIPKPFARVAICYGAPFAVPEHAAGDEFESYRQRLDDSLDKLEEVARGKLDHWTEDSRALSFGQVCKGHLPIM